MERHGMTRTPEYTAWASMWQRCGNPKAQRYPTYGGRGITVCDRWMLFGNFLADMGKRPTAGHSLDRVDNDGNYERGNCRWATRSEQQLNKRIYTDPDKLPRGDGHWTRRDPERAATVARRNIKHHSGSANGNARLTEAQVSSVKRMIANGVSDIAIAEQFEVRPGTIWFIRSGKHWRHVA